MRLGGQGGLEEPEINLVSLIDVLFCLILFLVLTTSFNQRAALKLAGMSETVRYFQAQAESNWLARHQPDIWAATHKYLMLSGYLPEAAAAIQVENSELPLLLLRRVDERPFRLQTGAGLGILSDPGHASRHRQFRRRGALLELGQLRRQLRGQLLLARGLDRRGEERIVNQTFGSEPERRTDRDHSARERGDGDEERFLALVEAAAIALLGSRIEALGVARDARNASMACNWPRSWRPACRSRTKRGRP